MKSTRLILQMMVLLWTCGAGMAVTLRADGPGVLFVMNKGSETLYVWCNDVYQGCVPAGRMVYMPREGFVTQDSGLQPDGTHRVTHAYGGWDDTGGLTVRFGWLEGDGGYTWWETSFIDQDVPEEYVWVGDGLSSTAVMAQREFAGKMGRSCPLPKPDFLKKMKAGGVPLPAGSGKPSGGSSASGGSGTRLSPLGEGDAATGVTTSMLLLIDLSGSMSGVKLAAAKNAGIQAIEKATAGGRTEVAVWGYEGSDCSNPIKDRLDFTTDVARLKSFINGLQTGGDNPLATAYKLASEYMARSKSLSSRAQLMILLADGDDCCGGVDGLLSELKRKGFLFRTETIGLDIESNAKARQILSQISSVSGGKYYSSPSPDQLVGVMKQAIEAARILDMLGQFGGPSQPATSASSSDKPSVSSSILNTLPK